MNNNKTILIALFFLVNAFAFGQVGINTSSPQCSFGDNNGSPVGIINILGFGEASTDKYKDGGTKSSTYNYKNRKFSYENPTDNY